MISTLYDKLKAAVRPTPDDRNPASADRRDIAQVNEARTDEERWSVSRRF